MLTRYPRTMMVLALVVWGLIGYIVGSQATAAPQKVIIGAVAQESAHSGWPHLVTNREKVAIAIKAIGKPPALVAIWQAVSNSSSRARTRTIMELMPLSVA